MTKIREIIGDDELDEMDWDQTDHDIVNIITTRPEYLDMSTEEFLDLERENIEGDVSPNEIENRLRRINSEKAFMGRWRGEHLNETVEGVKNEPGSDSTVRELIEDRSEHEERGGERVITSTDASTNIIELVKQNPQYLDMYPEEVIDLSGLEPTSLPVEYTYVTLQLLKPELHFQNEGQPVYWDEESQELKTR